MPSPAQRLQTGGYLAGWQLVRRLPERVALSLFERIADRIHAADGKGVQRLRANLARAGVTSEETVRDAVRSYLRYWCESFRLPGSVDDLVQRVRVIDEEHFSRSEGRGVVLALPHMGNWDWAGAWVASQGIPLMAVAERLEPERLYDEFVAYRKSIGIDVVPLTGGADPMSHLVSCLGGNGVVALLADRDLSRSAVTVQLLGEAARMPVGPAVLSRRSGAPLVPVTLWYDGRELVIRFHEPIPSGEVEQMMQGVADAFTTSIKAHPVDWHMMQKVFEADL